MKYVSLIAFVVLINTNLMAQETDKNELPYYQVPEYYSEYTVGTVVARMIDGLGFRYRWATEDLREKDLLFRVSEDGRTIEETMDHIFGLSNVILNAALEQPTNFTKEKSILTSIEKRKQTLENLKQASQIFQKTTDLEKYKLTFISKNGQSEYPFWNNLNGPIEDAVWHAGQLVMMRRASGNPLRKGINFLRGTVRE